LSAPSLMHTSCQRAHAHVFFFEHPPLPLSTCIYHANAPICALMHARKRPYTHAHRPSYAHTSAHMSHITHCCHINVTQMHMPCQVQIEVIFPLATTSFKASIHAGFRVSRFGVFCALDPQHARMSHTRHAHVTRMSHKHPPKHTSTRTHARASPRHALTHHAPRHPGTHTSTRARIMRPGTHAHMRSKSRAKSRPCAHVARAVPSLARAYM
jgi:hypothetical protein